MLLQKKKFDPLLTLLKNDEQKATVSFSDFTDTFNINIGKTNGKGNKAKEILREVPAKKLNKRWKRITCNNRF